MFDQTKKPLESLAKAGTKEALKGLGKSVKEGLGGLLETVINQSKDIFKWFGNLFENIKEKGLKESLMGPFIGFLSFAENLGKNEKEASEKTKPTPSSQVARAELKKDVEKTTPKPQPKPFDQNTIKSAPYRDNQGRVASGRDEKLIIYPSGTARLNFQQLAPRKIFRPISSDTKQAEADIQKIKLEIKEGQYSLSDIIPTSENVDQIERFYLNTNTQIIRGNPDEKIQQLNSSGKTLCDIIMTGSQYERSVGFKGVDGKWYVFDPYRNKRGRAPIPFEKYAKKYGSEIKFIVPINNSEQIDPMSDSTESLESLNNGEKVTHATEEALMKGIKGENCWDWCNQVYNLAGYSIKERKRIFKFKSYEGKDCGSNHASEELVSQITPGDWLYINNKNTFDQYGNHSIIFLEWIDKTNRIARTASCPGANRTGLISSRTDFKKTPVTYIGRSV